MELKTEYNCLAPNCREWIETGTITKIYKYPERYR